MASTVSREDSTFIISEHMDYEKMYKEALERAKKFYNELAACRTKQKVAAIFPELRESEDERIREDLIGGLMWQRDNLGRLGKHDDSLILPGLSYCW